jgi:hypothetical protein
MPAVAVVVVFGVTFSVGCSACNNCRRCVRCHDCREDRPCATTMRVVDDVENSHGIRIESARYGRDDEWVDVTPQVRGLVSGDTIVFPRDLQATFNVDPIPGRMKYVEMTVVVDGRVMEMTVGDNLHVKPLRLHVGSGRTTTGGAATTREGKPKQ